MNAALPAVVPTSHFSSTSEVARPLRILVAADVPPDPNAGASGTVFQMNAALRRLGHDVEEIWGPELGRRIQHGNLHYLLELPRTYRHALRQRLKTQSYDVVEFNQPHAHLAAEEFRRLRATGVFVNRSHGHEVRSEEALDPWREQLGFPQPRRIRGMASRVIRRALDRQWERIARVADGFHVSCREDAEFLRTRYDVPTERIGVVTQGIPDIFRTVAPAPMTDSRRKRLLYVGQLAFFKAPQMLARTVNQLLESRPELTMTWVCSASHHAAARALLCESIQSRVTLLDWMPQDGLVKILDEHGVFLFPSFFEGFGKAPLEAMARGLCVIASNTGGMRDFIVDGVNGRLVPIGQPEQMAQAARDLIDHSDRCQSLSTAARETALQHTWDRCARDLTVFYRALLHRRQLAANGKF